MISFYLTNRERKLSPISILVSFRGKKYRKCIGESVSPERWNNKKQRVRITSQNSDASYINDQIDSWEKAAMETIAFFKDILEAPSNEEFKSKLMNIRYKTNEKKVSLVEYFDIFISRYANIRSKSRTLSYIQAKEKLKLYQDYKNTTVYFEDIDAKFRIDFESWFYSKGYSTNYFSYTLGIIKQVVNEARDVDCMHSCYIVEKKYFSSPSAVVDNIYLTEDELLAIHRLDLDKHKEEISRWHGKKYIRQAKDLFIIGAFTGLRFCDYSQLKTENVKDGNFYVNTKKTNQSVVIPVHWVVKEILDLGYDYDKKVPANTFNVIIKNLARLAEINDVVSLRRSVGGKVTVVTKPKYEFVCSHTARRSFATNAYKSGIPAISIMKITGHRQESCFLRYIKISEEENAERLQNHEFFSAKVAEPKI